MPTTIRTIGDTYPDHTLLGDLLLHGEIHLPQASLHLRHGPSHATLGFASKRPFDAKPGRVSALLRANGELVRCASACWAIDACTGGLVLSCAGPARSPSASAAGFETWFAAAAAAFVSVARDFELADDDGPSADRIGELCAPLRHAGGAPAAVPQPCAAGAPQQQARVRALGMSLGASAVTGHGATWQLDAGDVLRVDAGPDGSCAFLECRYLHAQGLLPDEDDALDALECEDPCPESAALCCSLIEDERLVRCWLLPRTEAGGAVLESLLRVLLESAP